jgi:hypothetical protein
MKTVKIKLGNEQAFNTAQTIEKETNNRLCVESSEVKSFKIEENAHRLFVNGFNKRK